MKVQNIRPAETAVLHLRDPLSSEPLYDDEEKKKPVTITLVGKDSEAFRKAEHAIRRKRTTDRIKTLSPEREFREGAELLAACTVAWQNIGIGDEDVTKFTHENAVTLYMTTNWIREQVDLFIIDRENFFLTA